MPNRLLLDEPTQQLDLAKQAEILDRISDLNPSKGITVVAAIHDLNLAARYFGRFAFLHNTCIAMQGSPAQVLSEELLSKFYCGHTQVLHLAGQPLPDILPLPQSEPRRGQVPGPAADTKEI
jgi:iron complex transport system ATP-binding protein